MYVYVRLVALLVYCSRTRSKRLRVRLYAYALIIISARGMPQVGSYATFGRQTRPTMQVV